MLSAPTYQFITQLGAMTLIDSSQGPVGPQGTVASLLVGANGWHNGTRLPHDVAEDLKAQGFDKEIVEGIEYFKVPAVATNLPGLLSHYAGRTGVADLQNPPGGGVNALRADQAAADIAHVSVDPVGVSKFVEDNDSVEEARTKTAEAAAIVDRAVDASTPAREPANADLVQVDASDAPKAKPAAKKGD